MRDALNRREVWLLKKEDIHFKLFRDALDARRKVLFGQGIGTTPKRADPVTKSDEEKLWESDTMSTTSALGLSNGVYFYNCKIFGFRSKDEHVELQVDQYSFGTEDDGRHYLQYNGRLAKTITGKMNCKATPRQIRHYAQPSNPRCVVSLFRTYLSLIPPVGRFYRRPLSNTKGKIAFSVQPIGINKLSGILPQMCTKAGVNMDERTITGHSGKVTCCTRLYEADLDDQAITSRSGHHSNAVRSYKRPSLALEQRISDTLQPPMPKQNSPQLSQPTGQNHAPTPSTSQQSHCQGCIPENTVPVNVKKDTEPKPENKEENVLHITVPSCVTNIVITKGDGKDIAINL